LAATVPVPASPEAASRHAKRAGADVVAVASDPAGSSQVPAALRLAAVGHAGVDLPWPSLTAGDAMSIPAVPPMPAFAEPVFAEPQVRAMDVTLFEQMMASQATAASSTIGAPDASDDDEEEE
jgi:hypothetical protein